MVRPVKTVNKTVCPDCDAEFTGKTCPECGTTKGLKPLASDGIPKDMHKQDIVFGNVDQLSTSSDLLNDDAELLRERAEYQKAETNDNLRESLVLKSKIKNMELEREMLAKKIELDRYRLDPVTGPAKEWPIAEPRNQQHDQVSQQPQSLFGPVSPQASFMSQLMKMEKDKRGDFLEQLTDADPNALQTLSGMFQQNPMSNPMTNPTQMQQYPPWMNPMYMQQQQQPQESVQDPMVGAVEMMGIMFKMFESMQPKPDTSANEKINDLKGSLEKMNDKLDSKMSDNSSDTNDMLRSELQEIKARLSHGSQQNSFSDNVKMVKEVITDIESMGLINQQISNDTTVDDKLKLQDASHKIEMDNKRFDLEKDKVSAEEQNATARANIVSAMMKGRMQRKFSDKVAETEQQPPIRTQQKVNKVVQPSPPKEVFDKIKTDAGVVLETRKAVSTV